ncbi:MAG: hypothetical protein EA350_06695 [Gemmatimonadales bacterium]|nr:MAG: hypothetical protein EA350_06695 [Gemmatimonadales bacterium]
MSEQEVDLDHLIEAAGRSFGKAQEDMGLPDGMSTGMVISEAELDLKVGFRFEGGRLAVEPVSAAAVTRGGVSSEALSTIKVRYVATRSELPPEKKPTRSEDDVVREVRARKDVTELAGVLGSLQVNARYVPDLGLWATRVEDDRGRIIRSLNIQDRL